MMKGKQAGKKAVDGGWWKGDGKTKIKFFGGTRFARPALLPFVMMVSLSNHRTMNVRAGTERFLAPLEMTNPAIPEP